MGKTKARARIARIARKLTVPAYGVDPVVFKPRDMVRVMTYGDVNLTGIVKYVDASARKIGVHVFQSLRSANSPLQFDPSELALMWRPRGDDPIDTPVDGYPGMEEIEERAKTGEIE